jgi:hypothetical protein
MTGRGRGSGEVPAPIEVDRTREMSLQVVGACLGVEGEPAVDDPHLRIPNTRRDLLGRPEEVGTRERAHGDNLAVLRGNLRRGLALVRLRTHRGPALAVTLYERAGCHLCEETHRALRRIGLDRPLAIERVDIASDAALEVRYVVRIPVLGVGGNELDAAGLSDSEIAAWLRAVAP